MALNAKNVPGAGGGNRVQQDPLEPGVYPARLVQIIDLGLQPQRPYQGQDKPPAHEIMLTYELLDEFMKDEDGEDVEDKPRWISETFPLRNLKADKAKSTLRYNVLDPSGAFDGDFTKTLDTPVNLTVVNNISGDKVYNNVGNIASPRARDLANFPELKNPAVFFDLDDPDMEVYAKLPQWIQEKLGKNLNFKGSALEKELAAGGGKRPEKAAEPKAAPVKKARAAAPVEDDEDDNPY